jgi:DDE superfamily endonuclease
MFQCPKNADVAKKCVSHNKKGYTVKVLLGVQADGNVCFLSHIYQGTISDLAIVHASGLFSKFRD